MKPGGLFVWPPEPCMIRRNESPGNRARAVVRVPVGLGPVYSRLVGGSRRANNFFFNFKSQRKTGRFASNYYY
jgi:hypothetical protein